MAKLHEIQGYVLVLDKVVHITRVFEPADGSGAQFNVQLSGNALLKLKFTDRGQATLQRDLLIQALENL